LFQQRFEQLRHDGVYGSRHPSGTQPYTGPPAAAPQLLPPYHATSAGAHTGRAT